MKFLALCNELFFRALSLLPLRVLYVFSDALYFLVYHVVRYRRRLVRSNIVSAFSSEKDDAELRRIERGFYHFFCDYIFETLKTLTISADEMKRRMVIEGVEAIEKEFSSSQCSQVFVYLGHYCNWEWVSSLPLWCAPTTHCAQIYRPLNNAVFEHLFVRLRSRFGAENIAKNATLRRILQLKSQGQHTIVGFISDQSPRPENIHVWTDFLHHDTPVFSGTERIGKKVNAAIYFADIRRVRRGYYRCQMRKMTDRIADYPDYTLTEEYMRWLEAIIRRQPAFWLWSHNRWKHTRASVNKASAER
ncbi:MAG: lysophospholipid acyltransferase family protein [Bacteroidales bacterium]|nr:lysophospholipid acyltransferase family protein [Candidatus Equimonas enterica]